ncbi:MAG: M14 family metallopeptidase [Gammaproteobacteria bacterium]|nr:M14 family metallopeptidase [Gammaproteobacteria bacterium]
MLDLLPDLNVNCFPASYSIARKQFLAATDLLCSQTRNATQTYLHPLRGPSGEELACDVVFLGDTAAVDRVLVVKSATHGVEGFAGSAIQVDCLPLLGDILKNNRGLGIVLIHALNPWGFAWLRRYDHECIDLNRNFINFSKALPEDNDYEKLYSRLSDTNLLDQTDLAFLWKKDGLDAYSEVVTRGQYTHIDGCFYGGRAASWSRQVLEKITQHPMIQNAKHIAVIDLHTGLGPYGYGELINDHLPDTASFHLVEKFYGANAKSVFLGDSCSTVKEGLIDYHWHSVMGERGCFVTLEFGTYSLEQLLTTLFKEQLYHNSLVDTALSRDIDNVTVRALKDFFYPMEKSWQQQVLFRGRQVVSIALKGLCNE